MSLMLDWFEGAAAPPAFNPLTQVTALHAFWAGDPNWTPPADGGAVTSVRNQSGGGDPANVGSPTFRASVTQLGNKPAVEFDGTDDALVVDVTDQAQPFKSIAVFRYLTVAANITAVGFGSGAAAGCGLNASSRWMLNNGSNLAEASGSADTAGHVIRSTSNSSSMSSQLWRDGTSTVGPGDSGAGALQRVKLGAGGTGTHSRYAHCQIAFCGIYSGATSDTDLATLAADLKTHYSL